MERRKFEDSFQEAFKDAEVYPSENVWTNIELDLEKAEGDKMKRRLIFFKTLAAASVTFAMSVAGVGYFMMGDKDASKNLAQSDSKVRTEQAVTPNATASDPDSAKHADQDVSKSSTDALNSNVKADETTDSKHETENQLPAVLPSDSKKTSSSVTSNTAKNIESQDAARKTNKAQVRELKDETNLLTELSTEEIQSSNQLANEVSQLQTLVENGSSEGDVDSRNQLKTNSVMPSFSDVAFNKKSRSTMLSDGAKERKLPTFYAPAIPTLKLPVSNADPGMLLLAKLAEEEQRYARAEKNERKKESEKLWTSVGFAAGGFSAINPSVSSPSNSFYSLKSSNTASKQSRASGLAYSVGVSLGAKLSQRWVVQGGLNYMTQMSDYLANSVVVVDNNFDAPQAESLNAFSPQLSDLSDAKVAQTYPYNVNNNVRFVSFPVQAGYLVVNRKFGVQLNAGLSTDLFLQNTITPEGGGLSSTTQSRGDDSPYRSVNFSGLMGTEFSYRLGNRYRVALNPGLRYPLNSLYKENTGVNANPLTLDVGLRFRYIFQ